MSKYTIWQNYDVNVDDFREWLEEEFPDVDDEWEKQRLVDELNWLYLDDERSNLNVSCESEILVFGTLGLWDRKHRIYSEEPTTNISDMLHLGPDCDYAEFFVDEEGDFCSRQSHHDGTNIFVYRCWKPELSEEEREIFRDAIFARKCDKKMIAKYTNSLGPLVKKVYGWT